MCIYKNKNQLNVCYTFSSFSFLFFRFFSLCVHYYFCLLFNKIQERKGGGGKSTPINPPSPTLDPLMSFHDDKNRESCLVAWRTYVHDRNTYRLHSCSIDMTGMLPLVVHLLRRILLLSYSVCPVINVSLT